jgi:hypothetical protein
LTINNNIDELVALLTVDVLALAICDTSPKRSLRFLIASDMTAVDLPLLLFFDVIYRTMNIDDERIHRKDLTVGDVIRPKRSTRFCFVSSSIVDDGVMT